MLLHLTVWVYERILTGLKDYLATEQDVNVSVRDCLSPFQDLVILSFAALATALRLTVSLN